MRYRDTRGDDDLVGTLDSDVFRVTFGDDTVDGGDGRDRLIVDYHRQTALGYAPDRIVVSEANSVFGELWGGDRSHIEFRNIERLTFRGGGGRDLMEVQVAGTLGRSDALTIDAGDTVGDTLNLYFLNAGGKTVAVDTAGTLHTSVGTFAGFERIAVFFGDDDDTATGGAAADYLYGREGDDTLSGGGGDDFLYAGPGADVLTGGGGRDSFYYHALGDSRGRGVDRITDFSHADGDVINLSRIDANPDFERNQAFAFIDQRAFSGAGGTGGEIRQQVNGDGTVTVQGDVNHDGIADFAIVVETDAPLVANDFAL